MANNSVTAALIVYCFTCAAYLRFYKWSVALQYITTGVHTQLMCFSMYSINRAASGEDPRIEPNQDIRAYDRENDRFYPYKSHGQYLRAWYGLCGCVLIAFFNGWRSLIPPMSVADFVASYINVSPLLVLR
jgi:amino acid transporter